MGKAVLFFSFVQLNYSTMCNLVLPIVTLMFNTTEYPAIFAC